MPIDPRKIVGILSNENIPHQPYGYIMGYSKTTKVLLYYDIHKHRVKRSHNTYVDEYDIKNHTKEHLTPG